jgi:dipeptidyl aminopeptidase/acylaminoacyl peptidase
VTAFARKLVSQLVLAAVFADQVPAVEQERPLLTEDCVRTRRIVEGEVHLSPDGVLVAYVVKSPDLIQNRNNYQLYTRDLRQLEHRENGRLLLTADKISGLAWLDRSHIVAQVEESPGQSRETTTATIIDIDSGKQEGLGLPATISGYSISANGQTVVFSTRSAADAASTAAAAARQKERDTHGYRVPYGDGTGTELERVSDEYEIYLGERTKLGPIEFTRLQFQEPGEVPKRTSLRNVSGLKLSPDGRYLLFRYTLDKLPQNWNRAPLIKELKQYGTAGFSYALGLYEIDTGKLRVDFNYPSFEMEAVWAKDSKAYAVAAPSPFDSEEGRKEADAALEFGDMLRYLRRFSHTFVIDAATGAIRRVLSRDGGIPNDPRFWRDLPLGWNTSHGGMLVRADDRKVYRMTFQNGQWREMEQFVFTEKGLFGSSLTSDGKVLVGIAQSPMTPPELLLLNLGTKERTLLTDLNPDLTHIALGEVERIEWTNRYGSHCIGHLIKPVGYEPGRQYPLVFMAATNGDGFITDANYTTAFAPQSLANADFLVLMAAYPEGNGIPKSKFPGEMGMAYDWMSMVESAIDLLAGRGLADKNNVGIVGFSRTSWLTDFTLTHSKYRFTAASSADSGIYTYGGYYEYNSTDQMKGYETQIGGPPYGKTLANWLEYATPFNAEHMHTPVLMEYTGDIRSAFEFFVALNRLGKQVELYNYPKGAHPLDTPIERVASLQRNVDWFRFWMQGYERPNPEDPEQYGRWRTMRSRAHSEVRVRNESLH